VICRALDDRDLVHERATTVPDASGALGAHDQG
jgi:hypothetical protein